MKWIDLNTKTVNTCTWSGELKSAIENSQEILIDSAGSYFLVAKSQDMYVFEMNGNCPKTSQKTKWSVGAWTHSMEFHPGDDNIMYVSGHLPIKVCVRRSMISFEKICISCAQKLFSQYLITICFYLLQLHTY